MMGKGCERVFAISSTQSVAFYPPNIEERETEGRESGRRHQAPSFPLKDDRMIENMEVCPVCGFEYYAGEERRHYHVEDLE